MRREHTISDRRTLNIPAQSKTVQIWKMQSLAERLLVDLYDECTGSSCDMNGRQLTVNPRDGLWVTIKKIDTQVGNFAGTVA